jgi:hypothetical protein
MRAIGPVVALALFTSLIAGTPRATAAATGDVTYKEYKSLKPQDKYMESLYIAGMVEGLTWANGELAARHSEPLFCQPANLDLTLDQDLSIVDGYIERHPETPEQRLGILVVLALEETFPCRSGSGAAG